MAIDKVDVIPKYVQIPSNKKGVKSYKQGELIMEISDKGKTWIYAPTGKIVAKGPLNKDVFQKSKPQPVDLAGKIVNKDGIINN